MARIIVALFLLILLLPLMSTVSNGISQPVIGSLYGWTNLNHILDNTTRAEVFSGLELAYKDIVVGVGPDHSAYPHKGCFVVYHLGDDSPSFMECLYLAGIGMYDAYSPWRNGSVLLTGWRDPNSGFYSAVFVFTFNAYDTMLTTIIDYDDPDYSDEEMTMVLGYDDTIIVSGKVTGTTKTPAIYIFRYENGSWQMKHRITDKGNIIFRNDDGDTPRVFVANITENKVKIYKIDPGSGEL